MDDVGIQFNGLLQSQSNSVVLSGDKMDQNKRLMHLIDVSQTLWTCFLDVQMLYIVSSKNSTKQFSDASINPGYGL